ncbi:diguanylate cyclase [Vibrio sp. SG41-7]|uniref:sensor domain-containing diguanylate cyclase n=1 Tax=Vibrio sp. SG41-7 TaxID=2760973 RepID=UPI0015FEB96B|nr:diguanylate cyclase [Vibrio sp. SG41-7]MBB1465939.1 diguanylate cyclase [Vibrio sp. SG41-7]
MVYLAIAQLQKIEKQATDEASSNIRFANAIIRSTIEATFGKLYYLQTSLNLPIAVTENTQEFNEISNEIITKTPNVTDIIRYYPQTNEYIATRGLPLPTDQVDSIQWHSLNSVLEGFYISSIYQKSNSHWVFAIKYLDESNLTDELWIEFDLLHTTQRLKELKVLNNGYVYIVDLATERLVFHPNPKRIGSKSVRFNAGISQRISQGETSGQHEYYFQNHFKASVFNVDNDLNLVLVAGTDRQDILTSSHQFTLTAIALGSLLLLWTSANYLTHQMKVLLGRLNKADDLENFKHELKATLDSFTYNKGIQFCLYQPDTHAFNTLDYHGNKTTVLTDPSLANRFTPGNIDYLTGKESDLLAQKLKIRQPHYRIPLHTGRQLIAVIYVSTKLPINQNILHLIKEYAEVSLSHLLLKHQINCKDQITNLDNKSSLRLALNHYINEPDTYLALLDIDNWEDIKHSYGKAISNQIIRVTAEAIRSQFPKPKGLCLAHLDGKAFAVLFKACNITDATCQLEQCQLAIASKTVATPDSILSPEVHAGLSGTESTSDSTFIKAEQVKLFARRSAIWKEKI